MSIYVGYLDFELIEEEEFYECCKSSGANWAAHIAYRGPRTDLSPPHFTAFKFCPFTGKPLRHEEFARTAQMIFDAYKENGHIDWLCDALEIPYEADMLKIADSAADIEFQKISLMATRILLEAKQNDDCIEFEHLPYGLMANGD